MVWKYVAEEMQKKHVVAYTVRRHGLTQQQFPVMVREIVEIIEIQKER
ncbi:MAG: hypothetical protein AABX82_05270 [Nanoarchaeota archaeon]